jgi:hypothetical protein
MHHILVRKATVGCISCTSWVVHEMHPTWLPDYRVKIIEHPVGEIFLSELISYMFLWIEFGEYGGNPTSDNYQFGSYGCSSVVKWAKDRCENRYIE